LFAIKEIVDKGCFENKKHRGYLDIISKLCEVGILFFDPLKNLARSNSRIYTKAYERILSKCSK